MKTNFIFILLAIFLLIFFLKEHKNFGVDIEKEETNNLRGTPVRVITAEPMDMRLRHERNNRWAGLVREIESNQSRYISALDEQFSGEEGDPIKFREEKIIILTTAEKHLTELLNLEEEHNSSKSSLVEIRKQKYRVNKLIEDVGPYAR